MSSKKHIKRHWEKVRDYLASSFFEDISRPSFSTTSEEEDASSTSTPSADLLPPPPVLPRISPLPELIIERVNRENRHDEPEEFYDKLEAKIKKLMNNIQEASQSDDINDLDTIKLMDISQDSATEDKNFDVSPNRNIRNATYTIVNDFSTKNEINDTHSEPHVKDEINVYNSNSNQRHQTIESATTCDVKAINNLSHFNENQVQTNYNSNNDTSEPESSQKTDDSYEESITFTPDPEAPEIMRATNKKSFRTTRFSITPQDSDSENDIFAKPTLTEKKHSELQVEEESITFTPEANKREPNESVSIETIANVHSVPKNYTPYLLHTIGTVNVSKSTIIGLPVNEKAKKRNCFNSEYNKDHHFYPIPNESNFEREPHEVPNESVSIETIANVHSVPKNCTPTLLHIIGTVNVPKSPILGRPVNKKSENENSSDSEYSNSENSSTSAETVHESVYSGSSLEESSDINRMGTILEESESQFEDTRDSSSNDFEDGDATSGPQSQNDNAPKANSSPQNDPEAPEIMRATNKKSFRTTRFSLTPQDSDSENDIFAKPTFKKENHGFNLNLEDDVVVNTNYVTSTTLNYSVHETDATSPEYVDKSHQCEIQSSPNNTRKRRANVSVNDAHSVSGDGANSNCDSLNKNFFIGAPKICKLCTCKNHSCKYLEFLFHLNQGFRRVIS